MIRAAKPYTNLVRSIESRGGRVTAQYRNFDGIAAVFQPGQLQAITALAGPGNLSKDLVVPRPHAIDTNRGRRLASAGNQNRVTAASVQSLRASSLASLATTHPTAYSINSAIINAASLHASGINGNGIVVAVIDSGIRPGYPHLELDGSVVGCEDFVGDPFGCTSSANDFHGTFVAGMISANAIFGFSPDSSFRDAVLAECPTCFSDVPVNTAIPMIGTAPLSSIYALRVFGPTGGAPVSRILEAIDKVIDLRKQFDRGLPEGVNIKVCNLSFGVATLLPPGDLESAALVSMIDADIVPVVAASNAGPATLTVGSPASSLAALTVGAASLAHNERINERLLLGPFAGALFRPFLGTQTAYFSSRGPNADGRTGPDVSANGFDSFGQGLGGPLDIIFASGTSFAAPSVAGVAAVLRQAVPSATARQVRNAIISSANPSIFGDGSSSLDRGAGYVDALAARNLLASGKVPNTIPSPGNPNSNLKVNIEQNTTLKVRDGFVHQTVSNLKPGQRSDILYRVNPNTRQVIVAVSNVTPANPPSAQNQLFGDDILIAIHSAKTSSIGDGDYKLFAFTSGNTFTMNDPEPGILRVSVNGDWTNAGLVSANVAIAPVTDPLPQFTSQGKIGPGQLITMPLNMPAGVARADFRLSWRQDWGSFPPNDLDLYLIAPNSFVDFDGVTLNAPETAAIDHPMPGIWTVLVVGAAVYTGDDKFELRIALDGKVVH